MKNFIAPGQAVAISAPAAVQSGDLVQVGSLLGVAQTDAAIGEFLSIVTEGVFEIPIASGAAIATGKRLIFVGGVPSLDATDIATSAEYATAVVILGGASVGGTVNCRVKINV